MNRLYLQRIKELRKARKVLQSEMADYLGVSSQSYSSYENGREMDYEKLIQTAKFFNVSTDYILGLTDIPKEYTDQQLKEENRYLIERLKQVREELERIQSIIIETRGI